MTREFLFAESRTVPTPVLTRWRIPTNKTAIAVLAIGCAYAFTWSVNKVRGAQGRLRIR